VPGSLADDQAKAALEAGDGEVAADAQVVQPGDGREGAL
jgi:hypothetical protein